MKRDTSVPDLAWNGRIAKRSPGVWKALLQLSSLAAVWHFQHCAGRDPTSRWEECDSPECAKHLEALNAAAREVER